MARKDTPSAADLAFIHAPRLRQQPVRPGGWTGPRIVTFIVTLAATGCVTRAAAATGLSRKSAYALERRDPAFACLWQQAVAAHRTARVGRDGRQSRKGDKFDETDTPPAPDRSGDGRPNRRAWADAQRDGFFAGLRQSGPTVATPS